MADIKNLKDYMKQRADGSPDPFSLQDELFEKLTNFQTYKVYSEDIGRLDLITMVAMNGSDKYEELIGVVNRIRDQFTDLRVDQILLIPQKADLRRIVKDSERLI